MSGLVNFVKGDFSGIQIGMFNYVKGDMCGIQIGLVNTSQQVSLSLINTGF